MSPTKRASTVSGLRRAVAPAPSQAAPEATTATVRIKPVRITVDLSPADYEALNHWIGAAAARVTAAPGQRVTLSKAIRAMIRATTRDENVTLDVLGLLREDSERR